MRVGKGSHILTVLKLHGLCPRSLRSLLQVEKGTLVLDLEQILFSGEPIGYLSRIVLNVEGSPPMIS